MGVADVADVAVDVFVVAVVGFAAALALGMVVGRKRAQEMRVLVLLVALLGVAGLVHGVRVAYVPASASTSTAASTTTSTTRASPTISATTSSEQAANGDRTEDFIALIGTENYLTTADMKEYGAPGPNSRGTWPCRGKTNKVVWTYQLGGAYRTFHAVARVTGKPEAWPKVTFAVYADGKQVFTGVLDPVDMRDAPRKSEPVEVNLDRVQSLRLEVVVESTKKCDDLVANWADIKVT